MATVRISIDLPYLLVLPPGEYPTPGLGEFIRLADGSVNNFDGTVEARTDASSALFDAPDVDDAEAQERQRRAEEFWQELSISYGQRNKIIHEGQIAHEDDAKLAIRVARNVVQIVVSLPSR